VGLLEWVAKVLARIILQVELQPITKKAFEIFANKHLEMFMIHEVSAPGVTYMLQTIVIRHW
jgi:hypothetical protein